MKEEEGKVFVRMVYDSVMISRWGLQFVEIMNWGSRAIFLRSLTKEEIMTIRVLPKSTLHNFAAKIAGEWVAQEVWQWTLKNVFPLSNLYEQENR